MRLRTNRRHTGFTLIELLVVIAISAILSALLLPAVARGKRRAQQVNEINAAKQLMLTWQFYSADNSEAVLPGYSSQIPANDHLGNPISSPTRDRYPWRLAPQLSKSFRAIYVNESRAFLDDAQRRSNEEYVYRASLYPSLGYNSVFLGGDEQKFNPAVAATTYGKGWLVTRTTQIRNPSTLLAFASSRSRPGGERDEQGYFAVHPPFIVSRQWDPGFDPERPPEKFGFVHPRWGKRVVAAMTDGHVETLSETKLQDMRLWCNAADRGDWTVTALR